VKRLSRSGWIAGAKESSEGVGSGGALCVMSSREPVEFLLESRERVGSSRYSEYGGATRGWPLEAS